MVNDFTSIHVDPVADTKTSPASTSPRPLDSVETAEIDEVLSMVRAANFDRPRDTLAGAEILLRALSGFAGISWTDKWETAGCSASLLAWEQCIGDPWQGVGMHTTSRQRSGGITALIAVGAIRPTYSWLSSVRLKLGWIRQLREPRLGDLSQRFRSTFGGSEIDTRDVLRIVGKLLAHTGKRFEALGIDDLLEMRSPGETNDFLKSGRAGLNYALEFLRFTGNIEDDGKRLRQLAHQGRPSVEQLVAIYKIQDADIREMFVQYLSMRDPEIDFASLRLLAYELLRNFWADIQEHSPGKNSLRLSAEEARGWKQRHYARGFKDHLRTLYLVRALYLDIASWATESAYWATWAAPSFVTRQDVKGMAKHRRAVQAKTHQRIRILSPEMPKLIESVEIEKARESEILNLALSAEVDQEFEFEGQSFRRIIFGSKSHEPATWLLDIASGGRINQTQAEHRAFWAWAIVNVLRETGIRMEELVELTATAIFTYKLPDTGEVLPLLQIVPSKTDRERILVVSPELAHVLAEIRFRVRDGNRQFPVATRYDHVERAFSPPLPFLFQQRRGHENNVFSTARVSALIRLAYSRMYDRDGRDAPRITAHDFRRVFATDSLSAGLPIHILAKLLGHAQISTTQGYAAVFDEDVIRHYRTHLSRRRALRPPEDYRVPGDKEIDEFHAHFLKRKVELGTCSRAYGTPCVHEHACVRCPMLRPDPKQRRRLDEIRSNLQARRQEAVANGWLGEIEGIDISLKAVDEKLATMSRIVQLSSPTMRSTGV
jgi:integrase